MGHALPAAPRAALLPLSYLQSCLPKAGSDPTDTPAPRALCASGTSCTQEQPENRHPHFQKDKGNRTHQAASGPQVDESPDITIRAFKPKYSSLSKPPASRLGWLQPKAVNMTTISSSQISTLPQVSLSVFREAKL